MKLARMVLCSVVGLVCAVRLSGADDAKSADKHRLTTADVERMMSSLSNWGRWGDDDELGTLNLITPEQRREDPTGVGDAFRAGLLAGLAWRLGLERAAQVGSMVATYVLEHVGTQEYELDPDDFLTRLGAVYGEDAAAEVRPHLG